VTACGSPATGTGARLTVELVGIPGSGKSRLARTLAASLAQRRIPVAQPSAPFASSVPPGRRLSRKLGACAAAAVASPARATRLTAGLLRSQQPDAADVAARWVQLMLSSTIELQAGRRPGVSIVDEGLVQSLWSIGLRGDVRPVLAALERDRDQRAADLLVVVSVAPELARARLVARASRHSRTQSLAEDAQLEELRRGTKLLDELVEWWSAWPPSGGEVHVVSGPEEDGGGRERLLERICGAIGGS
jgi:hypothetical protein